MYSSASALISLNMDLAWSLATCVGSSPAPVNSDNIFIELRENFRGEADLTWYEIFQVNICLLQVNCIDNYLDQLE